MSQTRAVYILEFMYKKSGERRWRPDRLEVSAFSEHEARRDVVTRYAHRCWQIKDVKCSMAGADEGA